MKKSDLVIGQTYQIIRDEDVIMRLEGFDREGDPVLLPISNGAKYRYKQYTPNSEAFDPACNVGCTGLFLDTFCLFFKPLETKS